MGYGLLVTDLVMRLEVEVEVDVDDSSVVAESLGGWLVDAGDYETRSASALLSLASSF